MGQGGPWVIFVWNLTQALPCQLHSSQFGFTNIKINNKLSWEWLMGGIKALLILYQFWLQSELSPFLTLYLMFLFFIINYLIRDFFKRIKSFKLILPSVHNWLPLFYFYIIFLLFIFFLGGSLNKSINNNIVLSQQWFYHAIWMTLKKNLP